MHKVLDETGGTKSVDFLLDALLILALFGFIGMTFLQERRATVFDFICLGPLIARRFIIKNELRHSLPKSLVIMVSLYLASEIIGALLSANRPWAFSELRRFVPVFTAGLLFTTPLSKKSRKILITFFFIAAALAGLIGILQNFGLIYKGGVYWGDDRPHGFISHPILYAAILAFVSASTLIMLFVKKNDLYQSFMGRCFLLTVFFLTSSGILFSGSRSVWIALVVACMITLFLYNRRKAFLFFFYLVMVCILIFIFSSSLRQRAESIVTSVYNADDVMEGTGNRLELWKGSLLLLKEHPFLGVGTWNFQSAIEELIQEKKVKEMPIRMHAHSLYFQALATRGITGFVLTLGLFTTLVAWGRKEIRDYSGIGGYIIILSTVLTIVGGLWEINIEINQYIAAYCLTIGLIGPYRADRISPFIAPSI